MNTKLIGFVALLGLSLGLASVPANAHGASHRISYGFGPAYVYYGNRYRPVDYAYRFRPGNRYGYYTAKQRRYRDRQLWHHCFDGHWYPYNDRQHRRYHDRLFRDYRKRTRRYYRPW